MGDRRRHVPDRRQTGRFHQPLLRPAEGGLETAALPLHRLVKLRILDRHSRLTGKDAQWLDHRFRNTPFRRERAAGQSAQDLPPGDERHDHLRPHRLRHALPVLGGHLVPVLGQKVRLRSRHHTLHGAFAGTHRKDVVAHIHDLTVGEQRVLPPQRLGLRLMEPDSRAVEGEELPAGAKNPRD